jgi:hypothetical protein
MDSFLAESGMADDIASGLAGPMASPIPTRPTASPNPVSWLELIAIPTPAAAAASPPSSGTTAPPTTPLATATDPLRRKLLGNESEDRSVATAAELKARLSDAMKDLKTRKATEQQPPSTKDLIKVPVADPLF